MKIDIYSSSSTNILYRDCVRSIQVAICKHGLDSSCVGTGMNVVAGRLKDDMHEEKMILANSYENKWARCHSANLDCVQCICAVKK